MSDKSAILLWLRRDLRRADHPALVAAHEDGPVVPLPANDGPAPCCCDWLYAINPTDAATITPERAITVA